MGRFQRVVTDIKVQCPAGEYVGETSGGTACHCRITRDVIDSVSEPGTLSQFCFGDYTACGVWRHDKEVGWATHSNRPLLDRDGNLRIPDQFDRERKAVLMDREREEAISLG